MSCFQWCAIQEILEWSNWYYARKKDWSDALAASQHETACARADRDQALKEKDQALEEKKELQKRVEEECTQIILFPQHVSGVSLPPLLAVEILLSLAHWACCDSSAAQRGARPRR